MRGNGLRWGQMFLQPKPGCLSTCLPINLPPYPGCRWLVSSRAFHHCRHEGEETEDQNYLGALVQSTDSQVPSQASWKRFSIGGLWEIWIVTSSPWWCWSESYPHSSLWKSLSYWPFKPPSNSKKARTVVSSPSSSQCSLEEKWVKEKVAL